jgi:hypothetical protein
MTAKSAVAQVALALIYAAGASAQNPSIKWDRPIDLDVAHSGNPALDSALGDETGEKAHTTFERVEQHMKAASALPPDVTLAPGKVPVAELRNPPSRVVFLASNI